MKKVKPKKCKSCGKEFTPTYSTLQKVCGVQCSIAISKPKPLKKSDVLGRGDYVKLLQANINKLVRLIDKEYWCISSGIEPKQAHAGHYHPTSTAQQVRFNLLNIWLQSAYDNTYKHGNHIGYMQGLIHNFGVDVFHEVRDLPEKYKGLKPTIEQLKSAIEATKPLIKYETKRQGKYTLRERVQKRREYNTAIGLYIE